MEAGSSSPNRPHPNSLAAMQACINHARALLDSANAVQTLDHQNIAYHLAALALEELGRRQLIQLQTGGNTRHAQPAWMQKDSEDHTKKLFWSFFGLLYLGDIFIQDRWALIKNFAKQVHTKRLAGLYVSHTENDVTNPADAINPQETLNLINLAKGALKVAESITVRDLTPEELDLQKWFLTRGNDYENLRSLLYDASLEKLAELKDTWLWIRWLKEQSDKEEEYSRTAIEKELERSRSVPSEGTKNKWRVRIRIYSQSHSIRPKALSEWNKSVDWIKLVPIPDKKNQLLIEFLHKDDVPIQGLWWFSWGIAHRLVTALNIATRGFWWWRLPEQISRYYEDIEELESGDKIIVERSPILKIDWGGNRVLTEEDLKMVFSCYAALPGPSDLDKHGPYNFYIRGVIFLSLNDIHWQCEHIAFGNFFESTKGMMLQSGDWQPGTPLTPALVRFLDDLFPDIGEKEHFGKTFDGFEKQIPGTVITLKEASFMKIFCDMYFLNKILPNALEEKQRGRQTTDF